MGLHVSEALEFLHSRCHLVHLNVKRQISIRIYLPNKDTCLFCSSNVLLGKDEKGLLIAKLADFGLSSYLYEDEDEDRPEFFYATMPVGTKSYMSPEAIIRGHVSPAVDIYAFGMVGVGKRLGIIIIHCLFRL